MRILEKNTQIVKCLDRLHNLLRAFFNKPEYWQKYLNETEKYYYPLYSRDESSGLKLFVFKFMHYKKELKKLIEASKTE